jgi:hypothetical protein
MTGALLTAEAAAVGMILGSIASSGAYRARRSLSMFTTTRSRCDHCGATVHWRDLVPALSWLHLGGRCRHCRSPISPSYIRTEVGFGMLFGGSAAVVASDLGAAATVLATSLGVLLLSQWRWHAITNPRNARSPGSRGHDTQQPASPQHTPQGPTRQAGPEGEPGMAGTAGHERHCPDHETRDTGNTEGHRRHEHRVGG